MEAEMTGLVLLCYDYSQVAIDEFNDWYDTEHIPERERVRGFLNAQRWLDLNNRHVSVAAYDLERIETLQSPEFLAISGKNLSPWSKRVIPMCTQILRFEGRQLHPGESLATDKAEFLLLAGVNAGIAAKDMYRAHADRTSKVPGIRSMRIFEGTNESVQFLELYELDAANVPKSKEWAAVDAAHGLGGLSTRATLILVCGRYRRGAQANGSMK
jgi:hypothetical protein